MDDLYGICDDVLLWMTHVMSTAVDDLCDVALQLPYCYG